MLKKLRGTVLMGVGYMLSPFSWWNDLFFNLPIAYLFAYLFSWIYPGSFMVFTIIGYWLSNILGIVMMQFGAVDVFFESRSQNRKRDLLIGFAGSTVYTAIVMILMYFHVLGLPDFLALLNLGMN
ncbi:hypothetical protein J5X98_19850 [Leptothermofonsia sichuanensis E412]|uniref:hypothetical protein n=1 Tax=Leptothermofonsia sichuanensis TaxID=2917832 RepID=UPI001CA64CAF|nr:hypothetical protein [Leptothermofonsia sichuanensis]QZZ19577.1 hypothetical protein J5X98_19850 [Leptothermofonsia sichuanensis E412]